jgi:hypothetical protein
MNKSPYFLGLAVAVGFAGGYGVRFVETPRANQGNEISPSGKSGAQGNDGFDRRASDRTAGGFAPPFAKGQAAAWLEAVSRDNWSNDPVVAMKMDQQFGRMDARVAEELALEGMRVWNLNFEDPANQERYPNPEVADHLAQQAFGRLAQLDPARALELMHHGEDQHFPDSLVSLVFGTVTATDPVRASAALAGLGPEDVEAAKEAVVTQWVKQDPRSALAALDQLLPVIPQAPGNGEPQMRGDRAVLRSDILVKLAKTDPDLALQAIGEGIAIDNDFGSLVQLSQDDHEMRGEIATWAESYSGPEAARIRRAALETISIYDSASAVELYAKIGASLPGADQAHAAADIAGRLTGESRSQASAWADTLPAGPVKEAALAAMVNAISRHDFGASSDLASDLNDTSRWLGAMAPSPEKNELTLQWIGKLQEQSADEALRWIDTLPEGQDKDDLRRETELKAELSEIQKREKAASLRRAIQRSTAFPQRQAMEEQEAVDAGQTLSPPVETSSGE